MIRRALSFLSVLALSLTSGATDLLVGLGGSGNMYPTISAALVAAVNGDRLLIAPGNYTGDLTLNKSVELHCNSNGQRFTVTGSLTYAPPATPSIAVINGMVLQGAIGTNNTFNGTHRISLLGCTVHGPLLLYNFSGRVSLLRDSILGACHTGSADILGCFISGSPNYNPSMSVTYSDASGAPSRIIGNNIGSALEPQWYDISSALVVWVGYGARIENNLIHQGGTTGGWAPITLQCLNAFPGAACTILNNTVRWDQGPPAASFIGVQNHDGTAAIDIRNNFLLGMGVIDATGTDITQAYNIIHTDPGQVNSITGHPVSGAACINAGDPEVAYTDLDLTRNDAGCYGGSLSRDNFDDALPATAIVGMVNAPRRTQASLTIPITADGFDR